MIRYRYVAKIDVFVSSKKIDTLGVFDENYKK